MNGPTVDGKKRTREEAKKLNDLRIFATSHLHRGRRLVQQDVMPVFRRPAARFNS